MQDQESSPNNPSSATEAAPAPRANLPLEGKKSNKSLTLVVGLVVGALVLVGGGLGVYYFGVRTPDSVYKDAADQVDTMLASVSSINSKLAQMPLLNSTAASTSSSSSSQSAATSAADPVKATSDGIKSLDAYKKALDKLKSSDVLNKDAKVKQVVSDKQKSLEMYSKDFTDVLKTSSVVANLTVTCTASLSKIAVAKSLVEFDAATKPCNDFLTQTKTVPQVELQQTFQLVAATILNIFSSSRNALVAAGSNNTALVQSSKAAADAETKKLVQFQAGIALYRLTPPADPSKDLDSIKSTIDSQQKLFIK